MPEYDWNNLLKRWSSEALASRQRGLAGCPPGRQLQLPPEVKASGWLGYPGATEDQLREHEARLGTALPPSYRSFLATTNGWRTADETIPELWPVEEIDWFRVNNQQWIDAYTETDIGQPSDTQYFVYGKDQDPVVFRTAYLQSALQISPEGDEAVYLLNPLIITADGEWEAWFFANWLPGARRHRSFWELMQATSAGDL